MMDQTMERSSPSTFCFGGRLPNPSSSPHDIGFRFVPTDVELLDYIQHKIVAPTLDSRFIMTADVYRHEPWFLPWDPADNFLFHGDERYFFVQRKPFSGKDTGTRPKRTIDSERGWWNSNTDDKPIHDQGGRVLGYVKSLTFFVKDETRKRKAGNSRSRKQDGIKTDWIMHEYMLEQRKVRQWVVCRIHYNGKYPLSFSPPPQTTFQSQSQSQSQLSRGPDLLQPSASKRLKSSGQPRVEESQESQPLEVQEESQHLQEENYEVAGVLDGDAETASWVDSLISHDGDADMVSWVVSQVQQESQQLQENYETAGLDDGDADIASWVDSLIYDDGGADIRYSQLG